MISLRAILIGFFSGVILTVGWVVFIDGQLNSHDKFPPTHILPPLFATFSAVCINLVSLNDVSEKIVVKVWLFFWVTAQCICVGVSIFILSTEYPMDANYPGVSILIQTILCMFATFLFFIGRQ
jgi:hypothetical protein